MHTDSHTHTHTHTHYKPLRSLNPDSRAPQARSLPASLTAGHHWVPQGPDLGPPFPPLLVTGKACSLHGQAGRGRLPGRAEARLRQKTGERQPPQGQASSLPEKLPGQGAPWSRDHLGQGAWPLARGLREPLSTCRSTCPCRKSRSSPAAGSRLVSQLCCESHFCAADLFPSAPSSSCGALCCA